MCFFSRTISLLCCFLSFFLPTLIFSGHFNSRIIISSQSFRLFSKKLRWFSFLTSCPRTGPSFPGESCREGIGAAAARPPQPAAGSPTSGWWPTEKKTKNLCRNWPLRSNYDSRNRTLIRTTFRKVRRPAWLAPWPELGNCTGEDSSDADSWLPAAKTGQPRQSCSTTIPNCRRSHFRLVRSCWSSILRRRRLRCHRMSRKR